MIGKPRISGRVVAALAGLILSLLMFIPLQASADPLLGGTVSFLGGDVTMTFVQSDADFRSFLFLYHPSDLTSPILSNIFNSDVTPPGTSMVATALALVGAGFSAGDEMVFSMRVDEDLDGDIEREYFMGPTSRNPDSIFHADTIPLGGGVAQVSFEDIFGGGDLDFNDHVFNFQGVLPQVPNPSALLLLGIGLVGAAIWGRKRVNY